MSKYNVTYEDMPHTKANGETTYYNLTMAGSDLSQPTTFVLHKSSLAPDQSMAELDHPVIMGLSETLGRRPDQIGIYSERDHEKYDLARLEVKARDPETNQPLYAMRRDHGALFEKDYVDKDLNKYEEQAKQREIEKEKAAYLKEQNQQMKTEGIGAGGAEVEAEIKELREKEQDHGKDR